MGSPGADAVAARCARLVMVEALRCTAVSALATWSLGGSCATISPTTAHRCASVGWRSQSASTVATPSVAFWSHAAAMARTTSKAEDCSPMVSGASNRSR
ncbi:hypothetical protein STENM223S_00781 [Streptomyces tendae]